MASPEGVPVGIPEGIPLDDEASTNDERARGVAARTSGRDMNPH